MVDDSLILESVEVDGRDKEILLVVVDTGKIILRIDHDSFEVACHDLYYMNGMTFIMVRAMEGCRLNLFVPLNLKIEPDVASFLKYWDRLKLQEVKMKRLNSFTEYLKVCRDFISENVDVEGLKPTYATEFVDNRDYGGSVFTYIHINISWGESWSDDFNKSYDLTDSLTSLLIDRKLKGEDDFNWFSEVMVQFRPKALDKEDFIKKPTFKAIQDWESDCLVTVDELMLSLKSGMGTEGSGYYSDGLCKTDIPVNADKLDKRFTHVIWYDK